MPILSRFGRRAFSINTPFNKITGLIQILPAVPPSGGNPGRQVSPSRRVIGIDANCALKV